MLFVKIVLLSLAIDNVNHVDNGSCLNDVE